MTAWIPLLLVLHLLAAIGWVGGMLFAHAVLRPSAMELEPPLRLALWQRVFARFFTRVWLFVVTLLLSGHALMAIGVGQGSHAVLTMLALGWVMAALYAYLYFQPWGRMRAALAKGDLAAAAAAQNVIRRIVATNLTLGLITSALGVMARYLG